MHKEFYAIGIVSLVFGLIGLPIISLLANPTAPVVTIANVIGTLLGQAAWAIPFTAQALLLAALELFLFLSGIGLVLAAVPRSGSGSYGK